MSSRGRWYFIENEKAAKFNLPAIKRDLIEISKKSNLTIGTQEKVVLYRDTGEGLFVPRYYGTEVFGPPDEIDCPDGWSIDVKFTGKLKEELHQQEIIEEFERNAAGKCGGIIQAKCGSGKSIMALYLLSKMKKHTIILVHKEFLMEQWIDYINKFLKGNFTIGKIQQDLCEYHADIVIGMIQSIYSRDYPEQMYKSFNYLYIDEMHHISAPTFFSVTTRFNPEFILGLSATARRGDGLEGVFLKHIGPILTTTKSTSVEGKVFQIGVMTSLTDKMFINKAGKFNLARWISSIARLDGRTDIIVEHAIKMENSGRKVMILTHRLKHVDTIIRKLRSAGYVAGKCVGGMNGEEVFESFRDNQIVVGTYGFISEAVDVPELNGLILATPHSDIEQAVGRLTRITVEKKYPIVTEIVDVSSERSKAYARRHVSTYNRLGFKVSDT